MLDPIAAREIFDNSTDFTIGLEEEFALLDPETLELAPMFELLKEAAVSDPVLSDSIAGELISSEIEIRSGMGKNFAEAHERQVACRRKLFELADKIGVWLGATGTHPFSDYRKQRIIDTPHYQRLDQELRYVVWRNNTFSLHVHVGVRGADRAIKVCDRLRPILPTLLAVSANSPFIDGRDSGLHSGRSEIFTRTFPRCGIPDAFGSWDAWEEYVNVLARTGSIIEFTQIWWSVRPHHAFGTVEVRICDAQMTKDESENLAGLISACVQRVAEEIDSGEEREAVPHRLIEENLWRAIRYGMDGKLIDLEGKGMEVIPAREAVERLVEWCGAEVAFAELNGSQRQRQMIEDGATPFEVYAHTIEQTRSTYYESV
jgi:carboxylate-amine ligase